VKISRRQLGWVGAAFGLTTAALLWWYSGSRTLAPRPMDLTLSAVEHTVAPMGTVFCTVHITNVLERRVVVQAELEQPVSGQWQIIPCSQPGPMYISALWLLDPDEVKTIVLPPPDRGNDVTYRMRVDYWPLMGALRIWEERLRATGSALLGKLRETGNALLGRKPPRLGFVFNPSPLITSRGGRPIDWLARRCAHTEAWSDFQQTDAPNPALAPPLFQFEGDWRRVGDP